MAIDNVGNRVTKLEIHQNHIRDDINEIKDQIKNLKSKTTGIITTKSLVWFAASIGGIFYGLQLLAKFVVNIGGGK